MHLINTIFILYGLSLVYFSIVYINEKKFPKIYLAIQSIVFSFILTVGIIFSVYQPMILPLIQNVDFSPEITKFINSIDFNNFIVIPLISISIAGAIGKSLTGFNLLRFRNVLSIGIYLLIYGQYTINSINTQVILIIILISYLISAFISYVRKKIIESKNEKSKYDTSTSNSDFKERNNNINNNLIA